MLPESGGTILDLIFPPRFDIAKGRYKKKCSSANDLILFVLLQAVVVILLLLLLLLVLLVLVVVVRSDADTTTEEPAPSTSTSTSRSPEGSVFTVLEDRGLLLQ